MKKGLFILFILFSSNAFSVLSPLNEDIREITTILQDPRLKNYLEEKDNIEKITKEKKGYLIITEYKKIFVQVDYEHYSKIGPRQFQLRFKQKTVRKRS